MSPLRGTLQVVHGQRPRNRTGIKLVDRSAVDYPDLAQIWFAQGRQALLTELITYLRGRRRGGQLRADLDIAVAARLALETLVFWAVHRHWDPAPQPVDADSARHTIVQMLVRALTEEDRR